jgi:NTE family protein
MEPVDETPASAGLGPVIADPRTALCLSGGGFRAALFHLGACRRLNELGILSKVDSIIAVSGGSILAGHLATVLRPWPIAGTVVDGWEQEVEAPFRRFVQRDLRTGPILRRWLIPWNWFRPATQVQGLEAAYRKDLTQLTLADLPPKPNFVFCATDMTHGVSWVFERQRVGSYLAGYLKPAPAWPLARAVAASSCFPPIFDPLPIALTAGQNPVDALDRRQSTWQDQAVSDGGLYDNLGLQPAERHGTILVSDGGQPFFPRPPRGPLQRIQAYLDIQGKQAGAVRKRLLIAQYQDRIKQGTYWGIGSAVRRYRDDAEPGYTKDFAAGTIATIRTDLDAFADAEINVLLNHGYLLADIAMRVHAPRLIAVNAELKVPHPEWLDENKAGLALVRSHERRWFGRR